MNNLQQLLYEQIQKGNSPLFQQLQQPSKVQSTALTRDLSDLSSDLSSIKTSIDEVFSIVNSSLISADVAADVLQSSIISPLLNLINNLSGLSLVQSVDSVYAAVLVVQTVLTVANTSLATFVSIANEGTNVIVIVQSLVDTVFNAVLSLLPSS